MKEIRASFWILAYTYVVLSASVCNAEDALVAVSTNFLETAKKLSEQFDSNEGKVVLASGSTGQIFAQINQGAPYHAFLSADQHRVNELVRRELAIDDSQFTYAVGKICFILAPERESEDPPKKRFEELLIKRIAIANPRIAPYGQAAIEALENVGWKTDEQRDRVTTAQNVGQAYAMVASGNADAGIVALSTIVLRTVPEEDYYLIPTQLHEPIKQDAVLLTKGESNIAAKRFLDYISSEEGKAVIRSHGYKVD